MQRQRPLEERTFKLGGEEFHYVIGVRPEEILPWFEMRSGESILSADGERRMSQREQLDVYDATIKTFLEPADHEKWDRVREAADPPLSLKDIDDLVDWLFEEQAGRPTLQPSGSSPGSEGGGTGTNSTESSPSEAVAV